MKLTSARVNYTHAIDYTDLPEDTREVLYGAAVNEDLGTQYDYVDGDFHVTPDWTDPDMVALTDVELQSLVIGEPEDSMSDSAYDALEQRLEDAFGYDSLQTHLAIEQARRYILSKLSTADKQTALHAMAAGHLAISFYQ